MHLYIIDLWYLKKITSVNYMQEDIRPIMLADYVILSWKNYQLRIYKML